MEFEEANDLGPLDWKGREIVPMKEKFGIRLFESKDAEEVEKLIRKVFTESESEQEGKIVGDLARDLMASTSQESLTGFLTEDLESRKIVGVIFFSRLSFDRPLEAFILSPVAVCTEVQRQGVGRGLISHGINEMKKNGCQFITTYGDPAYYTRFGFKPITSEDIPSPYPLSQPIGWLGQSVGDTDIQRIEGKCRCVAAFDAPDLW